MNKTNCPIGFATDELVQLSSDPCSVPLSLYVSLFSILCFLRLAAFVFQTLSWHARYYKKKAVNDGENRKYSKKRYPLMPFLSLVCLIVLIVFTILTSLGIATVRNNGSIALICLFWLPQFVTSHISVRRVFRLGKRILPLAHLKILDGRGGAQLDRLDKTTLFLNFLRVLGIITYIVNPIALLIFGFIFPGNYIPIAIGFSCYTLQGILMLSGLVYQYQRVISVVKSVLKDSINQENEEIRDALAKLRQHQITYFVIGIPGALFWLIPTSTIVPYFWWFIFIEFTFEIMSILGLAYSSKRKSGSKIDRSTAEQQYENNNLASPALPLPDSSPV